ncbi:hypothetical protein DICPUDRAFT_8590, partial [Dictyostelium purpureum]
PFSRIFILCSKNLTENNLYESFKTFGTIESCRIVIDKETNESKGYAYIKYSKTSAAALAIEEMNGKILNADITKTPIKVLIAEAKGTKNKPLLSTDPEDHPPNSRLFVVCNKNITEEELNNKFKDFGNLEHVKLIREKHSNESKGCAFVKYSKSSTACIAMETINEEEGLKNGEEHPIKVFIAQPKVKYNKQQQQQLLNQDNPNELMIKKFNNILIDNNSQSNNNTQLTNSISRQRLFVVCHKSISQENLYRLFSRYPGMEYCDLKKDKNNGKSKGFAYVNYSTPAAALMAKNELNGIKYPPGHTLKVVFAE